MNSVVGFSCFWLFLSNLLACSHFLAHSLICLACSHLSCLFSSFLVVLIFHAVIFLVRSPLSCSLSSFLPALSSVLLVLIFLARSFIFLACSHLSCLFSSFLLVLIFPACYHLPYLLSSFLLDLIFLACYHLPYFFSPFLLALLSLARFHLSCPPSSFLPSLIFLARPHLSCPPSSFLPALICLARSQCSCSFFLACCHLCVSSHLSICFSFQNFSPHEGFTRGKSSRRSLRPSREIIQILKNKIASFFYFLGGRLKFSGQDSVSGSTNTTDTESSANLDPRGIMISLRQKN